MFYLFFPRDRDAVKAMCENPARHWLMWVGTIISLLVVVALFASVATGR